MPHMPFTRLLALAGRQLLRDARAGELRVLFFALFALAVYSVMLQWWMFALFIAIAVMWPLGFSFQLLLKASGTPDYARLSRLVKWVMFNGILSMLFYMVYE